MFSDEQALELEKEKLILPLMSLYKNAANCTSSSSTKTGIALI
jgi:hypothetical protein